MGAARLTVSVGGDRSMLLCWTSSTVQHVHRVLVTIYTHLVVDSASCRFRNDLHVMKLFLRGRPLANTHTLHRRIDKVVNGMQHPSVQYINDSLLTEHSTPWPAKSLPPKLHTYLCSEFHAHKGDTQANIQHVNFTKAFSFRLCNRLRS